MLISVFHPLDNPTSCPVEPFSGVRGRGSGVNGQRSSGQGTKRLLPPASCRLSPASPSNPQARVCVEEMHLLHAFDAAGDGAELVGDSGDEDGFVGEIDHG